MLRLYNIYLYSERALKILIELVWSPFGWMSLEF